MTVLGTLLSSHQIHKIYLLCLQEELTECGRTSKMNFSDVSVARCVLDFNKKKSILSEKQFSHSAFLSLTNLC